MVTEVLAALDEVRAPQHIERVRPLDVVRHLGTIEPTGYDPGVDAILEEFLRIAPGLPWRQTAGYLDVLSADYLDNYGYVQLIGPPPSIIEHASVRVGIGLWGPDLDYPLHEHAAEELYHVLAGEPAFGAEDGTRTQTRPGDAIHTPSRHRHAQRFGPTPTLLLYCWTGDVVSDAVLVNSSSSSSSG